MKITVFVDFLVNAPHNIEPLKISKVSYCQSRDINPTMLSKTASNKVTKKFSFDDPETGKLIEFEFNDSGSFCFLDGKQRSQDWIHSMFAGMLLLVKPNWFTW